MKPILFLLIVLACTAASATVAALLGEDFTAFSSNVAPWIDGVLPESFRHPQP